nr:MAG TPA: hypothetical protein [Caudoviricetes sp.]
MPIVHFFDYVEPYLFIRTGTARFILNWRRGAAKSPEPPKFLKKQGNSYFEKYFSENQHPTILQSYKSTLLFKIIIL